MRNWKEIGPGKTCDFFDRKRIVIVEYGALQPVTSGPCGKPAKWRLVIAPDGPREWCPDYVYRCVDHRPEFLSEEEYVESLLKPGYVVFPYIPLQTPQDPNL